MTIGTIIEKNFLQYIRATTKLGILFYGTISKTNSLLKHSPATKTQPQLIGGTTIDKPHLQFMIQTTEMVKTFTGPISRIKYPLSPRVLTKTVLLTIIGTTTERSFQGNMKATTMGALLNTGTTLRKNSQMAT